MFGIGLSIHADLHPPHSRRISTSSKMTRLEELQAKRNQLATQIKSHADKFNAKQEWPDSEAKENWDKLNADYDSVVTEMNAINQAQSVTDRLAHITDLQGSPAPGASQIGRDDATSMNQGGRSIGSDGAVCTDTHRALAMAGWMQHQMGRDITDEMEDAAQLAGYNLNRRQLNLASPSTQWVNQLSSAFRSVHPSQLGRREYFNAPLTTQTAGTGGNVVAPETLVRELEINMLAFDGVSQHAELMVTGTGEKLSWPGVDDTGNSGVQIGENLNVDNAGAGGALPSFGKTEWEAFKLSSQAILVPYELIEDNVVNLPQVLGQLMGERIGRLRNSKYTNGTGTNEATGIVTAASLGVTAASATAIAPDEVYDLQHSVDPAYRIGSAFMAHDSIVAHLRKLKGSDGHYVWQSGLAGGVPDTLAGAPLAINQAMDSAVTTGKKTLLFGKLSAYKIRRVNGFRLYRLEERYRDSDQDGFILIVREDGNLLNSGTAPVKYLQQA